MGQQKRAEESRCARIKWSPFRCQYFVRFVDALLALERLGGDTGFDLGGQVSSFSFHRSDFGGDLPLSDQLKFQQANGSVLRDHFTSRRQ